MHQKLHYLLAAVAITTASCSSSNIGKHDPGFARGLPPGSRTAIAEINSTHTAKTGQGAVAGSAGGALGSLGAAVIVGAMAAHDATKDVGHTPRHATADYPDALDASCLQAIRETLHHSSRFTVISVPTPPRSSKPQVSPAAFALHAREHSLASTIRVHLTYSSGAGWNKPLKLIAKWDVISPDASRRTSYTTTALSEEKTVVFPNSADPRFHDIYVSLARSAAQKLLVKVAHSHAR